MFRVIVGLALAGLVLVGGLALLGSVLTYMLIPILGVIGALLGL